MRPLSLAPILLSLSACGAGGSSPTTPEVPTGTNSLSVVVFYDENANGLLDASEVSRVPGVVVEAGGRSARAEALTGRALLTGLAAGTHTLAARSDSLPPFYHAGTGLSVGVPQTTEVALPITLPIGGNRPGVYLAFGDSITDGEGASDEAGYRDRLQGYLRQHFGAATVLNDGVPGTTTGHGVRRIRTSLPASRPAWTLIIYGTNDWNLDECNSTITTCPVADNLARIVEHVKNAQSLPVLATIPPANTGYDDRAPADRNVRVQQMNDQIRPVARAQGAVLVDLYAAFIAAGDLSRLFVDHVHPNDTGYELIARAFFDALTRPSAATSADTLASPPELGFAPPSVEPAAPGAPDPARTSEPARAPRDR